MIVPEEFVLDSSWIVGGITNIQSIALCFRY